jgi:hypothetical protein
MAVCVGVTGAIFRHDIPSLSPPGEFWDTEPALPSTTRGKASSSGNAKDHRPTLAYSKVSGQHLALVSPGLLAEEPLRAGRPREGLAALQKAQGFVAEKRERWYEPELDRLPGGLMLAAGGARDVAGAESCFRRAIDVARLETAKSWELRAARDLARLWAEQGANGTKAHDLLTPVYGWFTEGFDTADLKDAKGLLEELA